MVFLAFVGVAIHQYFQQHPAPPAILANPDRIFPYFMAQVFPVGIRGLVVAAILAASLSSIDSALNSLTSIIMVDFYGRVCRGRLNPNEERNPSEQRREVNISRLVTLAVAVLGIFLSVNVSRLGTILEISNKIINGFTGPILGIFLLGMFTRRANPIGVFVGGLIGYIFTVYTILWSSPELMQTKLSSLLFLFPANVATGGPVLSFVWPSVIGLIVTLLIGYLISLVVPSASKDGHQWTWSAITTG
jgi:SSS family solute:Na+ symporter